MKIITVPEPFLITNSDFVLLLSGSKTFNNWQDYVISHITPMDIVLLNTRDNQYPHVSQALSKRCELWISDALEIADVYTMYIEPSNELNDSYMKCIFELGRAVKVMERRFPTSWKERMIITISDDYRFKKSLTKLLELEGVYSASFDGLPNSTEDDHYKKINLFLENYKYK